MKLMYNARTQHVYRNGAAVGRIEKTPSGVRYVPFSFAPVPIEAPTLAALLASLRASLARSEARAAIEEAI